MISLRKTAIVAMVSVGIVASGFVAPAFAAGPRQGVDSKRLDGAAAEYTQYRGYYRGGGYYRGRGWSQGQRNAAIAGAVGLGVLGAAAVAASRPAYADPYYDDGYYGDGPYYRPYAPVYAPPVVYQRRYYAPAYDFRDHR